MSTPYRSFWMAGFEGADHVNASGQALDLAQAYRHLDYLDDDYRRVAALGMRCVRESVGWRIAKPTGVGAYRTKLFDFSRALRCAEAARRHGLQALWTLMHYGMPVDVDIFDDDFAEQFSDFAGAAARALGPYCEEAPVFTPINEISFLAWATAQDGFFLKSTRHSGRVSRDLGWEVKCRLVKASLMAMAAIRAENSRARFLHIEPLVHVVPPLHAPHLVDRADEFSAYQWQSWDMLQGELMPELGGTPEALDLLGVNYYHNSQWELATGQRLEWHLNDVRRVGLAALLRKAWKRYRRPLLIAETSHVGEGRALWMRDIASEIHRARRGGVPISGVCIYPIIDRPDWGDAQHWHNSGLWDLVTTGIGDSDAMQRRLNFSYARAVRRAQDLLAAQPLLGNEMPYLIVFSHLRWDFVFQRPQHLLSRLAQHYHVIFVEEPILSDGPAFLERTTALPGVEKLRPHTPVEAAGFHDEQLALLQPLLADYLATNFIEDYVLWFYTPMALPLLNDLAPKAVVYDCMDELSAFKDAPLQMRQREKALLTATQLVLTGGPSLYEAKRARHSNVMCLPSAVDAKHYATANAPAKLEQQRRADLLQAQIGTPRLGFFGVIDERLDMELVAAVADAEREWQIVMVGPVVKIDPLRLPRRANIHWLGQQPYDLLPHLVASWDVCLMPFALNESTRFISPTKTLEYMAAGKPVVSTAINDVESMFSDVVAIAGNHASFVAGCRTYIDETTAQKAVRLEAMRRRVAQYSWEATATAIHVAITRVLDHTHSVMEAPLLEQDAAAIRPAVNRATLADPVDVSAA